MLGKIYQVCLLIKRIKTRSKGGSAGVGKTDSQVSSFSFSFMFSVWICMFARVCVRRRERDQERERKI